MEEVEILPRDAYLHTVTVTHAPCTIQWWFSTKRKNIDFGLFQRRASADDTSLSGAGSRASTIGTAGGKRLASPPSMLQAAHVQQLDDSPRPMTAKQRGGYFKLQDRNVDELLPLKHYESSKTTIKGSWNAVEPGTYVLYFDNSFSKNTLKRVSFCVAVKEALPSSSSRPPVVMSGWLLKKKRKRMQGWASRWISIQGHWLLYSTTEGGIPRAKVDLSSAVVSTSKADRTITVDGDEGFLQLRAQTADDFGAWVVALKRTKEHAVALANEHGGSGATFSAGAVVLSPLDTGLRQRTTQRDTSFSMAAQAHAGFETTVGKLAALVRGLSSAPDADFQDAVRAHLQQLSEHEGALFDCVSPMTSTAQLDIARKDTAGSGRPSLALTDTQASWFSGSGSEVFYETNEVLELADQSPSMPSHAASESRSSSYATPALDTTPTDTATDKASSPGGDSDSDSDGDGYFDGTKSSGTTQANRMRRDLIRDPDFIEALAQNSLRSPRPAPDEAEATTAGDVDYEASPHATIEQVRKQVDKYEPRTELPAESCKANVGVLSILRKNVGKDLSSIAMPLVMNEPINALQALCEELAYNPLLQRADTLDDSLDRLMHVAAFAISSLSVKKHRAERKPFNPLLGETYEMVEPLTGFRFVSEKVSHHPAIMACYADAPGFRLWQDSSGKSKFWGKSIELIQTSNVHVELLTHGDHFTYCKPSVLIRGLISGDRTVDFTGEMTIANHTTGDRCDVVFKEATMFSASNDAVECRIYRAGSRTVERVLRGSWSSQLNYEKSPTHAETLWTAVALPPDAARYYNFGYFTMRLNELLPAIERDLPQTDTRFRPDQRAYEEGRVDDAEVAKTELEEAQRARKRERDAEGVEWTPQWFVEADDADSPSGCAWSYKGGYWAARAQHAFPETIDLWNKR
ncbi:Oxysterol-binding protein 3 [Coemansia sp. RSA 2618]|nr:Oxysterol-binding protein 3 [Coemansia sp. RSA 2618]